MNEQFINVYIETIMNEVNELTKTKLMLLTRINIAEKLITSLTEEKTKLETELNKKSIKVKKDDF